MATLSHQQAFQFLSIEQLKKLVPAAFTNKAAERAKYGYIIIPTLKVLGDLEKLGWRPVDAHQMKAKLKENEGFQKHFIHLRNETVFVGYENEIDLIPEIVVANSYDARYACKIYIGSFRSVCGNRTVCIPITIPDPTSLDPDKQLYCIRHTGYNVEEFNTFMTAIAIFVDKMLSTIKDMQNIKLKDKQLPEFAKKACQARWDYTYTLHDTKPLLEPTRKEDESNDLWTVYNRVQEKIIKGGWIGSGGRTIKALKDPNRELLVNRRLFAVAEDFLTK